MHACIIVANLYNEHFHNHHYSPYDHSNHNKSNRAIHNMKDKYWTQMDLQTQQQCIYVLKDNNLQLCYIFRRHDIQIIQLYS